MLSRRSFQQLIDSILLKRHVRPSCLAVIRSQCRLCPRESFFTITELRAASSSSSTRWKSRQGRDHFAKEAKVQGLKSRAAFKLLEMNEKYKLFKKGDTVVDLGYAPGSWSQVAVNRTSPGGRVVGIDVIPAQPPKGASTIQGNFLSPEIQAEVRSYVQDPNRGRPRQRPTFYDNEGDDATHFLEMEELDKQSQGYLEMERRVDLCHSSDTKSSNARGEEGNEKKSTLKERDKAAGRVVDVVLSDMMMNTSGMAFRDHAGSMDLCDAALSFSFDTLRTGGHFLCKFYQGAEDKILETRLRRLFEKVHREKPESSRSESKEAYFVGLRRKETPIREEVWKE
ncbi:23S ribosomal RNA methyltransferase [Patellaria atrata CBS 101060]|uniref:rRNA methyltransferase 2, mitochondrial n=1 Tax=Patellaria atrata CBS 101060 TaxID=1346257 RepID=A0A9P4S3Q6_9PEZI|nr:23S ribosomal RNA methyltransferase [Patellaria atrata CBS 101060]